MQELPDIFPEEEDLDEDWYEEPDDDDGSLSLSIHTHTQQRYDECRKVNDRRPSNNS